ncbi:MAG: dipicolinate synthase [Peptococcaceae bacterium BICA1-7]|nr:MAG: dipicolinate synthase [Peptococcaceae bacterium BICA1-7]HBV95679.1 dipicolinate synthase subunit DpsA [Desulfotomaculum sp.]
MQLRFEGAAIALIGGDAREVILAERLAAMGARVKVVGLPVKCCQGIEKCTGIAGGLQGARAVILPVPGINDSGELYTAFIKPPPVLSVELLSVLPPGTPVLVGVARKVLREMTDNAGLKLIELMKLDEVALLNSIPSAEGAIQMAMENSDITIHGSKSLVLGFGRTGVTLALKLKALGSRLTVVARNADQRARAAAMGLEAADFTRLGPEASDADFLFNTVPEIILGEGELKGLLPSALIIDLASSPGGTNFKAAEKLGIKAILAPGLPGRVAPRTAGRILAEVVPRILAKELALV